MTITSLKNNILLSDVRRQMLQAEIDQFEKDTIDNINAFLKAFHLNHTVWDTELNREFNLTLHTDKFNPCELWAHSNGDGNFRIGAYSLNKDPFDERAMFTILNRFKVPVTFASEWDNGFKLENGKAKVDMLTGEVFIITNYNVPDECQHLQDIYILFENDNTHYIVNKNNNVSTTNDLWNCNKTYWLDWSKNTCSE